MSETHDADGPTVVVVAPGQGETPEVAGGAEVEAPGGGEAVAEAAVEIAAIEAERDVTLAVIAAEAEGERMDAVLELDQSAELEACRTRIAGLEAENLALTAQLTLLQSESEPPPSQPEAEAEVVVNVEEGPPEAETAPEPEKPKRRPLRWT